MPPTSLATQGFPQLVRAFLDEGRTLAQFDHPGIVRVWDAFEENNTAYLVMELLEGSTLGNRVANRGPLSAQNLLRVAEALCEALGRLHQEGLLHRDIKPDNVFLTSDGRAVLIDFGSAREFQANQTVHHTRMVTHGYAPLEQYASKAKFGPFTDIYSLSATLYFAATGNQPPSAIDRHIGAQVPALPAGLQPELASAIKVGMSIEIDQRPQTTWQFLKLMTPSERTRPAPSPPASPETLPGPRSPNSETVSKTPPTTRAKKGESYSGCGCLISGIMILLAVGAIVSFPYVGIPLLILLGWIAHKNSKGK